MTFKEAQEKAREEGTSREVTTEYRTFGGKGDGILGRLLSKTLVESSLGKGQYYQYLFDTDDGLVKCAPGMAFEGEYGPMVMEGGIYYIEYQGKEKLKGGRQLNKFTVEIISQPSGEPMPEDDIPF